MRIRQSLVTGVGVLAWASLVVVPAAWASEGSSSGVGGDQGAQATTGPDDADVLAGPRAEESDVPGASGTFSTGIEGRRAGNDARTNRWLERIIRSMTTDDAAPSIKLSKEQTEAVQRATKAHQERVQAHRAEHAAELRELREAAGYNASDERPARRANNDELTEQQQMARQRLREINRLAPTNEIARGEIWAALTETQRDYVNSELERMAAEAAEREAGEMMMGGEDPPGMMNGAPNGQRRADQSPTTSDPRLAELMRRIEALPEAQRTRVIERLLGALERLENAAQESRRREQPPTMDGVRVPGAGEELDRPRRDRPRPNRDSDTET